MITSGARYAIRALIYLALQPEDTFIPARRVAAQLDISGTFLSKIFKRLVEMDLVSSYRGPTGGLRLARPAAEITVYDVVIAVDGDALFHSCVLGLPGCGDRAPCPLHDGWARTRSEIEASLRKDTLADLAVGVGSGVQRVKP